MDDNPAEKIEAAGDDKLRLLEPQPLPDRSAAVARVPSAEADVPEKAPAPVFRRREIRRFEEEPRSINWRPLAFALAIILGAGAGVWQWRTASAKSKKVVIESPLDYHKRQFLTALRGDGTNAVPMQLRADRMRFHQRALISHGFLAERNFVFTNGAARARVAVNRLEGVSMEYAMVEPRGKDVLAVIAPRDDMPAWESLMRLAGAK